MTANISFLRHPFVAATALACGASMLPSAASASIIYNSEILVTGQGFGVEPRLLTVQETGNGDDVESACVAAGSSISFGSSACISDSQVYQGNGFTNQAGDEVNPQADNHKYGTPTLSEMGYDDASDIGLLFNATEPSGDRVNINDVTLKFYSPTGELLAAVDGNQELLSTNPGNGVAGFVFDIDPQQEAFLNPLIFTGNFGDIRIALESTISDAQGGPESWYAINLNAPPSQVPAPPALGLFMLGAAGLVWRRSAARKAVRS